MITPLEIAKAVIGKSTDTKPTEGAANGDCFFEFDTGDIYFWDEDTETWVKMGE